MKQLLIFLIVAICIQSQLYEVNARQTDEPALQSISIIPDSIDVKEGTALQLSAIGHYDNGKEKNLTAEVEWMAGDPQVAAIDANGTLTALNEGMTTIMASMNTIDGNASLMVYKELHGHRLPPEPDPAINDATLLGIDSNDNGVRDDVERTVYLDDRYSHPLVRAVALQTAKAFQALIKDVSKAKETFKELKKAMDCESYYKIYASFFNEPTLIERKRWVVGEIESMQMNTTHRKTEYRTFNGYLSGGILSATPDNELKSQCDFNISQVLGE